MALMANEFNGKVKQVLDRGSCLYLICENNHNHEIHFNVEKNENADLELIAGAVGKSVDVVANRRGTPVCVKIGGNLAMVR